MNPGISQAELVIMKLLWQQAPRNAQQLYEAVNEQARDKQWRIATVKTLINRLLKKGMISYKQQGRTYLYQPMIDKQDYLAEQNESFLNDLYDGKLTAMMAAFTSQEQLSTDEIKEIKQMIEKLEDSHE